MGYSQEGQRTRTEQLVDKLIEMGPVEAHRLFAKITVLPSCPLDYKLLATWYTPGVAHPCREIARNPEQVWELTGKANTVAVVTDGTRILGLASEGVIGAEASIPVMEGKAMLFGALGAVQAIPLALGYRRPNGDRVIPTAQQIIDTVLFTQAQFGGVNLEDITVADDKCHRVLKALREDPDMQIPIWHDDQQGTATVILGGLMNALEVAAKDKKNIEIACIGSGAAMVATIRLLRAWEIEGGQIRLVDSKGTVDRSRHDILDRTEKGSLKSDVQQLGVMGDESSKQAAIRGADIIIAASASVKGGTIRPEWIKTMREKAIVFAVANPFPEIGYAQAKQAGALIVGTGRSDAPNQINNSSGFPGIFRGVLDVRASTITDTMALKAAEGIARRGQQLEEFGEDCIIPRMDDAPMVAEVALSTAQQAMAEGLARKPFTDGIEYAESVMKTVAMVREMNEALMRVLNI